MTFSYRRSAQRVFWGPGALDHLHQELDRQRASRPLVVCGASVQAHSSLLPDLYKTLGRSIAGTFAAVRSHTPLASVQAASAALDELSADSVVVVGGGSALVTARAACILHGERRPIDELATRIDATGTVVSPRLGQTKLPIVALPTTPTTAVCKAGAAVTVPGQSGRLALFDPGTRTSSILLEPDYLASSPASLVRDATLNAFVMAVEGLTTGRSHVFSDALLVHAIGNLVKLLPDLVDDAVDPERRVDAALASILVGDATDTTGGGLTAALSHTIGHHHDAHNGVIDSILLPHVLDRVNLSLESETMIARSLGCPPAQINTRLRDVLDASGAPNRLRNVGVEIKDADKLAVEATGDFSYTRAAHQPDAETVADIIRSAW